jgi:beta-galactosidase
MWNALPASVTVQSATNADGERIHVIHNWSWTPVRLTLPQDMIDILADGDLHIRDLELGPWNVRVLAE